MSEPTAVLDLTILKHMEAECETFLGHDPMDCTARTRMAWCLFLQALQLSVQSSIEPPEVQHLLHDSLSHITFLTQFHGQEMITEEIQRLRRLIEALGGSGLVSAVEAEANHRLQHLYHDIHPTRRTA